MTLSRWKVSQSLESSLAVGDLQQLSLNLYIVLLLKAQQSISICLWFWSSTERLRVTFSLFAVACKACSNSLINEKVLLFFYNHKGSLLVQIPSNGIPMTVYIECNSKCIRAPFTFMHHRNLIQLQLHPLLVAILFHRILPPSISPTTSWSVECSKGGCLLS